MSIHYLLPKPVLPALPSNWAGLLAIVNSPETVAVMRHLPKKLEEGKGKPFPHSLRVQSIREGTAQQQEFDSAGHTASAVRKQEEMHAGPPLTFSFLFSPGTPRLWDDATQIQGTSSLYR